MADLRFFLEIPDIITTTSGRELWFQRLNQQKTYLEYLQVIPKPEVNAKIIQKIRKDAEEFGYGQPVFLIEPQPIEWGHEIPEGRRQFLISEGMTLERLPSVVCMADLHSDEITGKDECCSSLTVVWFQDNLAMPIDPIVEATLKAIDWDRYAGGWES